MEKTAAAQTRWRRAGLLPVEARLLAAAADADDSCGFRCLVILLSIDQGRAYYVSRERRGELLTS